MRLQDLERFQKITIQCHDNPDADAIASGYALFCYFKDLGKDVRLVYSGRNRIQKSNLCLMVERLHIPIEYIPLQEEKKHHVEGLLLTVDCQYGAGNVTGLEGDEMAIIDHHQIEITDVPLRIIQPSLGSCSTLVWKLLKDEGKEIDDERGVGTALYYGLYSDTNQFSELHNPLDLDMREEISYNHDLIRLFRNSNLSLKELEIAGIAMLRSSYNDDHEFAVIKAAECDPNILGLISDFLLQVDVIKNCLVFSESEAGYKLSVRSCIKEVNASELAAFLTEGIGSGGGHYEKAGGFISRKRYEEMYPSLHAEAYFNNRMAEYFDSFDVIYAQDYVADITRMKMYRKKQLPVGYVKADEVLPTGTPITIRTLEGDVDITIEEDLYIIIGIKGEVYPITSRKFEYSYTPLGEDYSYEDSCSNTEYTPTIKNRVDGSTLILTDYAKVCIPTGEVTVYVSPLEKGVKIFTAWDQEKYMLGRKGDYFTVRCDDLHDVYVVERDIFSKTYEEISPC